MIQLNEPSPPYWQTTPHTAEKDRERERERRDENEDIRSPSNETSKDKRGVTSTVFGGKQQMDRSYVAIL